MRGIIPALLTAYDADGAFDRQRSNTLVDRLIADGVHGLFVSGSTGESLLQSPHERMTALEATAEHVAGRIPLIAHVGALDTPTTLSLARFADGLGVDAVSAVTPIYYALDQRSHADYFRALADATDAPLIAYHIPGRSGVQLPTSWFLDLAADGVIQGVKYTATDLYQLAEIRRSTPAGFLVYNGSDEVLLGGLALGADGGIGSTYNAIPAVYLSLWRAFHDTDLASARTHQAEANHFIHAMNDYNFLAFLRQMLQLRGIEMGSSRAPLPSLSATESAALAQRVADDPVLRRILLQST